MSKHFFRCEESSGFVELSIDSENNIWLTRYYIEPDTDSDSDNGDKHIDFVKTLKNAFDKLILDYDCTYHVQYVEKQEWLSHLKEDDRWDIVRDEDDVVLIKCCANDAAACIIENFLS